MKDTERGSVGIAGSKMKKKKKKTRMYARRNAVKEDQRKRQVKHKRTKKKNPQNYRDKITRKSDAKDKLFFLLYFIHPFI